MSSKPKTLLPLAAVIGCLGIPMTLGQEIAKPSIESAVKTAWYREFGFPIEHPAIYDNPNLADCRGHRHVTTTAYLTAGDSTTVYAIYLSDDGTVIQKFQIPIRLLPAGKIRVLTVLVRYPETISEDALMLWEAAQKQVNEEHAAFARTRGFEAPIVVFENTNLVVDPGQVGDLHNPAFVRRVAERRGYSPSDYDIVMAIDINPKETAGGLSLIAERSIYVGNYGPWKAPLSAQQWNKVAATAYHHEMAHHWGWPGSHDWAPYCGPEKPEFAPFIAPPVLFGWEDLQGGHVPEILRDDRYGLRR